ncbi:unnamed protein product [Amoebophrya sp. A25]|nr:unnamed protein product [Amoebophrya sp. A25]|eukprot:GSA25T00003331001.1
MSAHFEGQQAQVATVRPPSFSIWSIGQGWEGTPADWTDYIFLTLGLFSLIFYLHQRNPSYLGDGVELNELPEGSTAAEEGQDAEGETEGSSSRGNKTGGGKDKKEVESETKKKA